MFIVQNLRALRVGSFIKILLTSVSFFPMSPSRQSVISCSTFAPASCPPPRAQSRSPSGTTTTSDYRPIGRPSASHSARVGGIAIGGGLWASEGWPHAHRLWTHPPGEHLHTWCPRDTHEVAECLASFAAALCWFLFTRISIYYTLTLTRFLVFPNILYSDVGPCEIKAVPNAYVASCASLVQYSTYRTCLLNIFTLGVERAKWQALISWLAWFEL